MVLINNYVNVIHYVIQSKTFLTFFNVLKCALQAACVSFAKFILKYAGKKRL